MTAIADEVMWGEGEGERWRLTAMTDKVCVGGGGEGKEIDYYS